MNTIDRRTIRGVAIRGASAPQSEKFDRTQQTRFRTGLDPFVHLLALEYY